MLAVVSLLAGFVLILAVGALLVRTGRAPTTTPTVLNAVVLNVTLPCLIVATLDGAVIDDRAWRALLASSLALVTMMTLTWRLGLWRGWSRPVIGSAMMGASFCNTAFLGIPVMRAVFPATEASSSLAWATAIVVDAGITSIALWTLGVVVAERFGGSSSLGLRASLARLIKQPMTIALAIAVVLLVVDEPLPRWWIALFEKVGVLTGPLVFLSLGAALDLSSLRFAGRPLLAVTVLKLAVSPALALLFCRLLSVPPPMSTVSVLQSGMSTAMVASIVAVASGCDKGLATGAAVVTTLIGLATLPLWAMVG